MATNEKIARPNAIIKRCTQFFLFAFFLCYCNKLLCQNPLNASYSVYADGETKLYYALTKLQVTFTKVNGNLQGSYNFYNKDGKISDTYTFDKGKFNGLNTSFNKNGDTSAYEIYKHDSLIFLKTFNYYPNGKLKDYYTADFSDSAFANTFPGADTSRKKNFEYDILQLVRAHYNKNQFKGYYKSGQLKYKAAGIKYQYNGPYVEYYESGKIKQVSNYKNNELDGKFIIYNEDGSFKTNKFYEAGTELKIEQ